jgi:hypothetical protein
MNKQGFSYHYEDDEDEDERAGQSEDSAEDDAAELGRVLVDGEEEDEDEGES